MSSLSNSKNTKSKTNKDDDEVTDKDESGEGTSMSNKSKNNHDGTSKSSDVQQLRLSPASEEGVKNNESELKKDESTEGFKLFYDKVMKDPELMKFLDQYFKANTSVKTLSQDKPSNVVQSLDTVMLAEKTRIESNVSKEIDNLLQQQVKNITVSEIKRPQLKAFSAQNTKLKFYRGVPRYFSIQTLGSTNVRSTISNSPAYINATAQAFGFGIQEARVVLQSDGITPPITLDLQNVKEVLPRASLSVGTVGDQTGRVHIVFYIVRELFKMMYGAQVILLLPELRRAEGNICDAGDLIRDYKMLGNQFVDQNFPLLPALGAMDETNYLTKLLVQEFEDPRHHMSLTKSSVRSYSQIKYSVNLHVITDQYFSRLHNLYLTELYKRTKSVNQIISQHAVLTFPNVVVKVLNSEMLNRCLVPVWNRDESDAVLLIYTLSVSRQEQYFSHLVQLLRSTNVLSFLTPTEALERPYFAKIRDPVINQVLNGLLVSAQDYDVYQAIAGEVSTTFLDITISETMNIQSMDQVTGIFKLFNILLWFNYFPAIAIDNAYILMYDLFSILQYFCPKETKSYLSQYGFATVAGKVDSLIRRYDEKAYKHGDVKFSLLTVDVGSQHHLFKSIRSAITLIDGSVVNTKDGIEIQTPRMRFQRVYYQPWQFNGLVGEGNVIYGNHFGMRLRDIAGIIEMVIHKYKKHFMNITNRNAFGDSRIDIANLLGIFLNMDSLSLGSIGLRPHCELYRLRELAQNSIYVLDDTFRGTFNLRIFRPQMFIQDVTSTWVPCLHQRFRQELKYDLPIFMFLMMDGLRTIEQLVTPDAHSQYVILNDIQSEAILFGDVFNYANNIKMGTFGKFQQELQFISKYFSSTRTSELIKSLCESVNITHLDVFQVLVDGASHQIDCRVKSMQIRLGLMCDMSLRTLEEPDTYYDTDLSFGRTYTDHALSILGGIFVPESSPIHLHSNGLIIFRQAVPDLDSEGSFDLEAYVKRRPTRVFMWDVSFLVIRRRDETTVSNEYVLRLPIGEDGANLDITNDMVLQYQLVFIVNSITGPLSQHAAKFLLNYFHENKILFYLPDLVVLLDVHYVSESQDDIDLLGQYTNILTRGMDEKLTLKLYDTTKQLNALRTVTYSYKWFWLTTPPLGQDIVLRGVRDQVRVDTNFKMSKWFMWAYGNGDTLNYTLDEITSGNHNLSSSELDGLRSRAANADLGTTLQIDKLNIGSVNFNNQLTFYTTEDVLSFPDMEQDPQNVFSSCFRG